MLANPSQPRDACDFQHLPCCTAVAAGLRKSAEAGRVHASGGRAAGTACGTGRADVLSAPPHTDSNGCLLVPSDPCACASDRPAAAHSHPAPVPAVPLAAASFHQRGFGCSLQCQPLTGTFQAPAPAPPCGPASAALPRAPPPAACSWPAQPPARRAHPPATEGGGKTRGHWPGARSARHASTWRHLRQGPATRAHPWRASAAEARLCNPRCHQAGGTAAHLFGICRRGLRRVELPPHDGHLVRHRLLGGSGLTFGSLQLRALPLVIRRAACGRGGRRRALRLGRCSRSWCRRWRRRLGCRRRRGGRRRLLRRHHGLLLRHEVALCRESQAADERQQRQGGDDGDARNASAAQGTWAALPRTIPGHLRGALTAQPCPALTRAVHMHRVVVAPVVAAKRDHAARHGHRQQRQPLACDGRLHWGVADQRPLQQGRTGQPGCVCSRQAGYCQWLLKSRCVSGGCKRGRQLQRRVPPSGSAPRQA